MNTPTRWPYPLAPQNPPAGNPPKTNPPSRRPTGAAGGEDVPREIPRPRRADAHRIFPAEK
jgi:hypothetical protein